MMFDHRNTKAWKSIFHSTITLLKVHCFNIAAAFMIRLVDWSAWLTHRMNQPITADTRISPENLGNLTLLPFFKNQFVRNGTNWFGTVWLDGGLTFDDKCWKCNKPRCTTSHIAVRRQAGIVYWSSCNWSHASCCRCLLSAVFRCRTWTRWSRSAATSPPTCSPTRTTSTSWVTRSSPPSPTTNLSLSPIAGKSVLLLAYCYTLPPQYRLIGQMLYIEHKTKLVVISWWCTLDLYRVPFFSQRCKPSWFHSTKLRSSAAQSRWFYGHIRATPR